MKEKRMPFYIYAIGVFFILTGILAIFYALYNNHPESIFWFCYGSILLIGIGILIRNSTLISSQIYILLVPDLIWITDFIYYIFAGHSFFHIVDYFFEGNMTLPFLISLQHLFVVPLTLLVLSVIKIKSKFAFIFSFIHLILLFAITRYFTTPEFNVNCVYQACGSVFSSGIYPFLWIFLSFLMVLIVQAVLFNISSLRQKHRK